LGSPQADQRRDLVGDALQQRLPVLEHQLRTTTRTRRRRRRRRQAARHVTRGTVAL
jgi:hypothetical protein